MSVTFLAPFAAPTTQIRIRNPSLNDAIVSVPRAEMKLAMDGSFYSTISTGTLTRFVLTFEGLTRRKILEIQVFLEASIGSYIRYIDKDNANWKIRFLDDPIEYTTTGPGLGSAAPRESNSITFNLEGEAL